jgi:uncharacterized protein YbcI
MKGNPGESGGPLPSKPTWSNASGYSTASAFFVCGGAGRLQAMGMITMLKTNPTMAQQIAEAAIGFEKRRNGHVPDAATVVLSEDTLVISLHGALSPAEKALARTPAGAVQVQEFHRQLFDSSSASLRQEIERITGVAVREATAEVETTTGTVIHVFTSGTMVQVFLLARSLPAETWSGSGTVDQP